MLGAFLGAGDTKREEIDYSPGIYILMGKDRQ